MLGQDNSHISTPDKSFTNKVKQIALPAVITVGMVILLLQLAQPEAIVEHFRSLNWAYVGLAFVFYSGSYLIRAWRLKQFVLLRDSPILILIHIVTLYNFFNYLLPARSGELSLIYFLRRYQSIPAGGSIGILILSRLFELSSMLMSLFAALIFYRFRHPALGANFGVADELVLVAAGILAAVSFVGTLGVWPVSKQIFVFWKSRSSEDAGWRNKLFRTIGHWADEVKQVMDSSNSPLFFTRLFLLSLLMWSCLFGMFWSLLLAMGYDSFSLDEIVIGSIGPILTSLLPINSVGNFGTLQIGWATTFALVGMSLEEGIAASFVVNIWVVAYVIILTIVSIITTHLAFGRLESNSAR